MPCKSLSPFLHSRWSLDEDSVAAAGSTSNVERLFQGIASGRCIDGISRQPEAIATGFQD